MNAMYGGLAKSAKDPIVVPDSWGFPKSCRILRSAQFKQVYEKGFRHQSSYFAAFCLAGEKIGPRLGFTTPRGLGKAVFRNRLRRRIREQIRLQMASLGPQWSVVMNPRRAASQASPLQLQQEIGRLFARLARHSLSCSEVTSS